MDWIKGFKMKKTAFLFVALLGAAAAAQDLPKIAVYVTGNIGENEKKTLGTKMLSTLVNSGRYRGIERSNAFLAEIEKEHVRQRSGDIDDSQISELGKQFGVKFVCIADLTPAFGAYQVSARIINVETAEVPFIGEASSPLKTMEDLDMVSVEVVRKMLFFAGESGGGARQAQQQPTVVIQQVQQTPNQGNVQAGSGRKPKYDKSMDFTTGERWGTWALNVVPGLGSAVIMKDAKGAITNAVIGFGGVAVIVLACTVFRIHGNYDDQNDIYYGQDDSNGTLSGYGAILWLGAGSGWNIYRSATYHHPDSRISAATPLQGFNP